MDRILMKLVHRLEYKKTGAVLFGLVTLLFNSQIFAQDLAVVYDRDGYTNIRKLASATTSVIGKIKEGQVFCISPPNGQGGFVHKPCKSVDNTTSGNQRTCIDRQQLVPQSPNPINAMRQFLKSNFNASHL